MVVTKLFWWTPRAENIMMFDFPDCADQCQGQPWRFGVMGSDKVVLNLSTPTIRYTVTWLLFTSTWIYSHQTAYCFTIMPLPVLLTIFECASCVLFLVAALAMSWWPNWCQLACCVSISDAFLVVPINYFDSDPLLPRYGGWVSMNYCCGIDDEENNEMKSEVFQNI